MKVTLFLAVGEKSLRYILIAILIISDYIVHTCSSSFYKCMAVFVSQSIRILFDKNDKLSVMFLNE